MSTSTLMPAAAETALSRPVRFVTATALFDGHDASINIVRRILQDQGAEVIHLGHNRPALDIVQAAVQEDASGIAIASYQGGHVEFFKYVVDLLRAQGAGHIQVFGGGGGVIVPREIRALEDYGVARIYSPEDGRQLGLVGMVQDMVRRAAEARAPIDCARTFDLAAQDALARAITAVEHAACGGDPALPALVERMAGGAARRAPVLGVTGTGGAGKSSLTDEIVRRFLNDFPEVRIGVVSVDPTRRRTGGALLGDRIRMNTASDPRVYMRSLATRARYGELSAALGEVLQVMRAAPFDLVIAETAGIGQGDAGIVPLADLSLYVMTAEFGAATQLEKIDMIDLADFVAINKFERAGSEDALRDVRKQVQRNRQRWSEKPEAMPVFGTMAARFNDDGVTALYHALLDEIGARAGVPYVSALPRPAGRCSTNRQPPIAPERRRYLAEIAECVRDYRTWANAQAQIARQRWQLKESMALVDDAAARKAMARAREALKERYEKGCKRLVNSFPALRAKYEAGEFAYTVRGREFRVPLHRESLAGTRVPRVAVPQFADRGEQLRWLLLENVPGEFPFTAGVFPFKREDEDPARMFAGEGDAQRTNARFKYLCKSSKAARLSTAFDSVTLYGADPDERPDIYGKIGCAGVSICTLEDMKALYDGFDLCSPDTSVSMTINGPAPAILAMFFNTAIDQQAERFAREHGRAPDAAEHAQLRRCALATVRGTVQADILKEDQGQNTCIFAIDFALRMMGDIQQFFIDEGVRNFYSVSISGYHIAEAGANPISELAFTLSNAFTYVEHYLSRGMDVDAFAPNLSFFLTSGMDPEYAVLNRVARRIWAVVMRERYGAGERSQKLKTHVQTSGRSLHAQEVQFNDIRTTLEALYALADHCNSLHTNAYDEAVTTPTEESVRRALAIQLIINREFGLSMNENPMQGSYFIEQLTDMVEEAVLQEFERIDARGGVLGAMERGYQRGRIQDESMLYEHRKSTGEFPIVGVNTFVDASKDVLGEMDRMELRRGTEAEQAGQVARVREFQARHAAEAPAALARLVQTCREGGNIFAELMHTVRVCSLGQITNALFQAGGQYRRGT